MRWTFPPPSVSDGGSEPLQALLLRMSASGSLKELEDCRRPAHVCMDRLGDMPLKPVLKPEVYSVSLNSLHCSKSESPPCTHTLDCSLPLLCSSKEQWKGKAKGSNSLAFSHDFQPCSLGLNHCKNKPFPLTVQIPVERINLITSSRSRLVLPYTCCLCTEVENPVLVGAGRVSSGPAFPQLSKTSLPPHVLPRPRRGGDLFAELALLETAKKKEGRIIASRPAGTQLKSTGIKHIGCP